MSIESVMPSNHLILCCPLLLLPSTFPSIRVFSNESVLHIRWPKYGSFGFSISPSNEYSGLISFGMDRLDLLAIQGTLQSLLQHHSSKASILWPSAFLEKVRTLAYSLLKMRTQWRIESVSALYSNIPCYRWRYSRVLNIECHSLKAPVLRRSAFFGVQLSHPYMTTGKTMALSIITSNFQIL